MNAVSLFEFQKEAILKLRSGCILCGGVGSGKSITSLAFYLRRICRTRNGLNQFGDTYQPLKGSPDLVIITTAKKRDSGEWEDELLRFNLHVGGNKAMGGVTVTIDSWNNMHKYDGLTGCFFIFDEQRLVGSGAWVKSFLKVAKANQWILLTATPGDSWMDYAPVFIANGFYKNRTQFERHHVVYSRWSKFPKIDRWMDEDRLRKCRRAVLVTMERPEGSERVFHDVTVGYDQAAYKSVFRDRWNTFKDQPIGNASEMMMCLRRIVNTDPQRFRETANLCRKFKRVIIFYNLNAELDQLRGLEQTTGIPVYEWNGHRHDELPDLDRWIYLVQYSAGCEGWNCITTNVVIFYSLNYSYKVMEQAAGRIDRLNTPYPQLHYYEIRSFAPVDRAIKRALEQKKNFQPAQYLGHLNLGKEQS